MSGSGGGAGCGGSSWAGGGVGSPLASGMGGGMGTTKYETEYVETADLPWGEQRQKQNGYTGYEVISYRNVYKGDGTLLSSNVEAKSNYKSRNQIILTGPPTVLTVSPLT